MDDTGLTLLNPPGVATWVSARDDTRPSILDLALANEAAAYSNQLSKLDVSMADSLGSDHAMLTLHVYPLDSLALIPPLQPKGYQVDTERQAAWTCAFQHLALPVSLIGSLSMGPPRRPLEELKHLSHDANGHSGSLERGEESGPAPSETSVQDQADALQQAIDNASKETL
jgi:hypothetical protein